MRRVLESGVPLVDESTVVGFTPADPEQRHAWSISVYRLEDTQGRVLGVAERWWTSASGTGRPWRPPRPGGAWP